MKYQVLFSLKNNEKIVVRCSCAWRFKGKELVVILEKGKPCLIDILIQYICILLA